MNIYEIKLFKLDFVCLFLNTSVILLVSCSRYLFHFFVVILIDIGLLSILRDSNQETRSSQIPRDNCKFFLRTIKK